MTPRATYRLQFTSAFTLDDAVDIVPYLARLGISHLYASPLLTARPGSTHGYDIVDHAAINPELGGMPALVRLVGELRKHDMGLLLDIVPNHMGIAGAGNRLWLDVMEWGQASPYATWFDIDWEPADARLRGKVLLPFLGVPYGRALADGDLVLRLDEGEGLLSVWYHDNRYPIAPKDYSSVLPGIAFPFEVRRGTRQGREAFLAARQSLVARLRADAGLAQRVREAVAACDVHDLLERQHYRLAWWRAAADEINYRRFFTVNELAGFRVEVPQAFEAAHALVFQLWRDGLIDGVRIDHIDGLAEPRGYCRKLRRRLKTLAGQRPAGLSLDPWILVEKILARHEHLPAGWQVDGTTGYEFMDALGGLLHDPAGEAPLSLLHQDLSGTTTSFRDEEVLARRQVLRDHLSAELAGAALLLHRVLQRDPATRDFTLTGIRRALAEIAAHFPAYRTYATRSGPAQEDLHVLAWALAETRRNMRPVDWPLLDLLSEVLSGVHIRHVPPGPARRDTLAAVRRFQQLTGPTAAKSVEDTAFYRYVRLISRNEVGSDPGRFSIPPGAFRRFLRGRRAFPLALSATATHDHKRGEDVRARIAVLSEIGEDWAATVRKWSRMNARWRTEVDGAAVLDPVQEHHLYQTMVGAWPLDLDPEDRTGMGQFAGRLGDWLLKALREAKVRTDWGIGNEAYEQAALQFLTAVLDPDRNAVFTREAGQFVATVARAGMVKSLSQLALKCLSIGLPDFYQGTEFWDFSLVDPDNRRPVDFPARAAAMDAASGGVGDWQSGALKQQVTARLLDLRRDHPQLFQEGRYRNVRLGGRASGDFYAQLLSQPGHAVLLVAPRLVIRLLRDGILSRDAVAAVTLSLPEEFHGATARCVFTGRDSRIEPRMSLKALPESSFPLIAFMIER